MRGAESIQIVPFRRGIDRSAFRCGHASLESWITAYAGQSERRDTTRTFLAVESGHLVGYYTLRAHLLGASAATEHARGRGYSVPAALIARLAVDSTVQGRGLGSRLLIDALQRILGASSTLGFEVVVVEAIDDRAASFYRKHGFAPIADDPLHLFITVRALRLTFSTI